MNDVFADMLIWLVGYTCLAAGCLIAARKLADGFRKRRARKS